MKKLVNQYLEKDTIDQLTQRSDWQGLWQVTWCWLLTFSIFFIAGMWQELWIWALAVIFLGGRMLHLAVLMHDAGHGMLFKTPILNTLLGNWLVAHILFLDVQQYGKQHNYHHAYAGTPNDPDINNFKAYPINSSSLRRKIARDLAGITGIKFFIGLALNKTGLMDKGAQQWPLIAKGILVNSLLFLLLWSFNVAALYWLWMMAFLTSYMLFLRIRQVAEHGAVRSAQSKDPREFTRTTVVNWLGKLLLAPANVHYHVEHHLLPNVPCYRLPQLHRELVKTGFFEKHPFTLGYGQLYKEVIA